MGISDYKQTRLRFHVYFYIQKCIINIYETVNINLYETVMYKDAVKLTLYTYKSWQLAELSTIWMIP